MKKTVNGNRQSSGGFIFYRQQGGISMQNLCRKDIEVIGKFSPNGAGVTPLIIVWEDGRKFEIDKVINITKAASLKAGGRGLRYTCRIRHREVMLFMDEYRWFMELEDYKVPGPNTE
jgi:hypothetical protein